MTTILNSTQLFADLQYFENQAVLDVSKLPDLPNQLAIIDLGQRDLAIAKRIQPFLKEHLDSITSNYYDQIQKEVSLLKIIKDNSSVERLKKTLHRHLFELFDGKIDEEFVKQRIRIAHVHVKIGLQTKWYMGAFQSLFSTFVNVLKQYIFNPDELLEAIEVVSKLLNLEQQLVLEAYEEEVERIKQEELEKKQIRERVSQSAEDISSIAEQTSASVRSLSKKNTYLLELATSGVEYAEDVAFRSQEGKQGIDKQLTDMNSIAEHTVSINKDMKDLQIISSEINEVVVLVKKIADQSNLLALNASIEAARAGEAGKSFNVVANEIRKLADKTKSSVEDVRKLIKKTNIQIKNVTEKSEEVDQLVQKSYQNMNNISLFFEKILEGIEESKLSSNEIENELKLFSHHFEEIQSAVGYLAETTEGLSVIAQDL